MPDVYDIVYFVKDTAMNEELRYSLRTVCENFPFRKIWFYGGRPSYLQPDEWIHIVQDKANKWTNTTSMIRKICENPDITDRWWLFNDDFFIMQRTDGIEAPCSESIYEHIVSIEDRHNQRPTNYTKQLRAMAKELRKRGLPATNFALHVPMLIDKKKALATLDEFPNCPMFRSLYGNYNCIEGTQMKDCKIAGLDRHPDKDAVFISTDDKAFENGVAGQYIRNIFREPCRYEL
jgi:hypothetical protein